MALAVDAAVLLVGGALLMLSTPPAQQSLKDGAKALAKGLAAMAEGIKDRLSKSDSGATESCPSQSGSETSIGSDNPPEDTSSSKDQTTNSDNSEHAETRMKERGISQERVDEAIRIGRQKPGNTPDTTAYEVPASQSVSGRGIRVVVNTKTNTVVTVIDKGSKFK